MKRPTTTTAGPTLEARPGSVHRISPDPTPNRSVPTVRSDLPLGGVLAAGVVAMVVMAGVVVIVQNSSAVELDLLWWSLDVPLAVLLVVASFIGALIAGTTAAFLRRRRRRRDLPAARSAS